MRIQDIYGPNARTIELFYIQPRNATCTPGTFDCDLGSHRGTLASAVKQAEEFYKVSGIKTKIVNADGEPQAYYP